jgi:DNA-binding response OmpR family regulator
VSTEDLSLITEHVLFVDDEQALRAAVSQFLREKGCEVLTAGREGTGAVKK